MAITITEAALENLQTIKKRRQTPEAVLRIGVRGGGCSGLSYYMDLVTYAEERDKMFSFDGNDIAVDRKSYLFLNGTEIGYEKTMKRTGFTFNNPLASRSCSCGESFTL